MILFNSHVIKCQYLESFYKYTAGVFSSAQVFWYYKEAVYSVLMSFYRISMKSDFTKNSGYRGEFIWLKISRLRYQPTIQFKLRDLEKYRKRNKQRRRRGKCNYNKTAKVWQLISWNANMRVNFAPTLSIPILIRFTSFVSRISISNAISKLQLGTKSATQNLYINNSSFLYIPI